MPRNFGPYSRGKLMPVRFRRRLITITSETGVGSSSLLDEIKKVKGENSFDYVSGGTIMRELAARAGMDIDAFAAYNREHPEEGIDRQCDELVASKGKKDGVVIESRLGHVFVPTAFHVLLTCPVEIRAPRRVEQYKKKGIIKTYDEVLAEITARDQNDNMRYKKLYPGCLWPKSHYDLVLETNLYLPGELVEKLFRKHAQWVAEKEGYGRLIPG